MKEDLSLYGNELNLFTTYFKSVVTPIGLVYRTDEIQYWLYDNAVPYSFYHLSVWPWPLAARLRSGDPSDTASSTNAQVIWGAITCVLSDAQNARTVRHIVSEA